MNQEQENRARQEEWERGFPDAVRETEEWLARHMEFLKTTRIGATEEFVEAIERIARETSS